LEDCEYTGEKAKGKPNGKGTYKCKNGKNTMEFTSEFLNGYQIRATEGT